MKLGIVGLPNVGKSTLFNAITNTQNAEAQNYPFCTIEPNVGIVPVPDARLDKLAEIWQTDKKTPAIIEFVDIAGLVKGASKGAGLGNKFLGNIREVDAIVHVVRCFDDENIIHVVEDVNKPVGVDPAGDIEAIDMELILSDIEIAERRLDRTRKAMKGDKTLAGEEAFLVRLVDHLSEGKNARTFMPETDTEKAVYEDMHLLSAKPIIYAANVSEDDLVTGVENNAYVKLVESIAVAEGSACLPICAKIEEDVAGMEPEEKAELLAEFGITDGCGLDKLIRKSYALLGLISFLTDGKKECRAWTIQNGTRAPQAAGKIHSDFERGFIRASVVAYQTFEECGYDMAAVRAKGLQRTEGKEYVMHDGDIVEFLFNV